MRKRKRKEKEKGKMRIVRVKKKEEKNYTVSGADKEIEMKGVKNKSVTKVKERHRRENCVTLVQTDECVKRKSVLFFRFQGLTSQTIR